MYLKLIFSPLSSYPKSSEVLLYLYTFCVWKIKRNLESEKLNARFGVGVNMQGIISGIGQNPAWRLSQSWNPGLQFHLRPRTGSPAEHHRERDWHRNPAACKTACGGFLLLTGSSSNSSQDTKFSYDVTSAYFSSNISPPTQVVVTRLQA